MSVLAVENFRQDGSYVTVTALVEDMHLLYQATMLDPAEYGPGLGVATFELDDNEQIPTDEDSFCNYLDKLNLDWEPVVISDDY